MTRQQARHVLRVLPEKAVFVWLHVLVMGMKRPPGKMKHSMGKNM
ncbi:MAG: hypothetical protein VB032_01595 [Burkholderiaceae bacterium]|nr:hypothetical protein [Burkholderiaceae bacterium]